VSGVNLQRRGAAAHAAKRATKRHATQKHERRQHTGQPRGGAPGTCAAAVCHPCCWRGHISGSAPHLRLDAARRQEEDVNVIHAPALVDLPLVVRRLPQAVELQQQVPVWWGGGGARWGPGGRWARGAACIAAKGLVVPALDCASSKPELGREGWATGSQCAAPISAAAAAEAAVLQQLQLQQRLLAFVALVAGQRAVQARTRTCTHARTHTHVRTHILPLAPCHDECMPRLPPDAGGLGLPTDFPRSPPACPPPHPLAHALLLNHRGPQHVAVARPRLHGLQPAICVRKEAEVFHSSVQRHLLQGWGVLGAPAPLAPGRGGPCVWVGGRSAE